MKKLEIYGIRGLALNWINSYLEGRPQAVTVVQDGEICFSQNVNVLTGVPQGSVLGPLLLYYIITLFADDTPAVISAKTIDVLSSNAMKCVGRNIHLVTGMD